MSLESLMAEMTSLRDEYRARTQQRVEVETKLNSLRNQVRGKRLPDSDYRLLCVNQESCVQQLEIIRRQMADLKNNMQRNGDEQYLLKTQTTNEQLKTNDAVDTPLRRELVVMRQHYMDFSADLTRISSMRQMAAEFAVKLDHVIKASLAKQREESRKGGEGS